jgi:hypothetical protein
MSPQTRARVMGNFLKWAMLAALCMVAGLAYAQTAPRRVALVIANSTYANAKQLAKPGNDARIVADALRRVGFQTIDLKSNLGNQAFRQALKDFRAKADGAQVALVYYAWHGIEGNGRNWLLPTDAALVSERDLTDQAIELDRVMEDVRGADLRVVILDACRDNPFGRSWRSGTRAVTRGLGSVDADELVIYAAAPGRTASDGVGANSPFAISLAQRLPQADLPIQLLGGMVRDDMLRSTGGEQRPFVSASITGTPFYFAPRSAPSIAPQQSPPAPLVVNAPPPPATFLDARTTPASTRAPLVRNPAALPDYALFRECEGCPEMVVIPAGSFQMGSPAGEAGRESDEGPQRTVSIRRSAISRFETTWDQWSACVNAGACNQGPVDGAGGDNGWGRGSRPIIEVDWNDAAAYAIFVRGRAGGAGYRLPTEAQWEYAARVGTGTRWSFGDAESQLGAYAWFSNNLNSRTQPVGGKAPNPWGLFDMHGNVWEWVEDCYVNSNSGFATNGSANTT